MVKEIEGKQFYFTGKKKEQEKPLLVDIKILLLYQNSPTICGIEKVWCKILLMWKGKHLWKYAGIMYMQGLVRGGGVSIPGKATAFSTYTIQVCPSKTPHTLYHTFLLL